MALLLLAQGTAGVHDDFPLTIDAAPDRQVHAARNVRSGPGFVFSVGVAERSIFRSFGMRGCPGQGEVLGREHRLVMFTQGFFSAHSFPVLHDGSVVSKGIHPTVETASNGLPAKLEV